MSTTAQSTPTATVGSSVKSDYGNSTGMLAGFITGGVLLLLGAFILWTYYSRSKASRSWLDLEGKAEKRPVKPAKKRWLKVLRLPTQKKDEALDGFEVCVPAPTKRVRRERDSNPLPSPRETPKHNSSQTFASLQLTNLPLIPMTPMTEEKALLSTQYPDMLQAFRYPTPHPAIRLPPRSASLPHQHIVPSRKDLPLTPT